MFSRYGRRVDLHSNGTIVTELIFVALSSFAATDSSPLKQLEASGHPVRIHSSGKRITPTELIRDATQATIVLAGIETYDSNALNQLPFLRCISRCGVGVDSIDLATAKHRGVVVANTPHIPTQAVAELALAMILSLCRRLRSQANLMQARQWERLTSNLLGGRTVGIIGLGRIGQKVARLCRAFDAHVLAIDPLANAKLAALLDLQLVDQKRLLSESDIICLHASKSPGETALIGSAEFSQMKRGTILINLARGGMVDEAALLDALRSGHISGAGLDVFHTEPYTGPLCDFDNVILTPHTATLTIETRAAMELQCVSNALDFLAGTLPAENRVV